MIIVHPISDGEAEYLPNPDYDNIIDGRSNGTISQLEYNLWRLYSYIKDEQNYFQSNSPTMFGNPEYSRLSGLVVGFCSALEFNYNEDSEKIVIKNNSGKRTLMIVYKPKRSDRYKEDVKDINNTWKDLLS